ncbi:cytosolic factor SEC14 [Trypanosoma rangeli]|uniref:Cytosolic factor SEC14 n=1 Tax=Trypanosoma rangeli TaxID=5698 RepID=A0A3R7LCT9_TRYRA|nr:cytosolic factor SEC14 [Trypanosoma rangeli]RNF11829.1 cytosolic factor SEC14 [Trypanosoma rangeli]|eukprot:RNF11829.1 cytosolic factor SEC14 [Trypanosoma rangeli]
MMFAPLDKSSVKLGMRVQNRAGLTGTVRWIGNIDKKQNPLGVKGTYVGVEFDEPTLSPDRHDGSWGKQRYFTCSPGRGELLKPKAIYPEANPKSVAILRQRYGDKVADWHDFELVKFSIARNFEMTAVYTMLENHFEWVASFKPSCDEYFPDSMCEDYPCGYSGAVDYDNNIIYCERPGNAGKCTPAAYMERYSHAVMTRWHACVMEIGKKLMRENNYKFKRVCYVVDLSNVGLTMNRSLIAFGRTIAALDQANYPEHLGRLLLVNCPKFFRMLWKVFRMFIDSETDKKVIFVPPGDGVNVLKRYMREEDIPDFAGGPSKAWRSNNCRIGSADPLKVFKGVTTIPSVTSDDLLEGFEEPDEEGLPQEDKRNNSCGGVGSSGYTSESSRMSASHH